MSIRIFSTYFCDCLFHLGFHRELTEHLPSFQTEHTPVGKNREIPWTASFKIAGLENYDKTDVSQKRVLQLTPVRSCRGGRCPGGGGSSGCSGGLIPGEVVGGVVSLT